MPVIKEFHIENAIEVEIWSDIDDEEKNSSEPVLLTYKPLAEHRFTNPNIMANMEFNEHGVLVRKKHTKPLN